MSTYLETHILQTLPPSCLNRDGEGRPKTAWYGGSQRMRVSSQAWKRAIRVDFRRRLDVTDLGLRSREFSEMTASRLGAEPDETRLLKVCGLLMKALGLPEDKKRPGCTSALQFLGESEWSRIATVADRALASDDPEQIVKDATSALKKHLNADTAIDVALFGRMAASDEKGDNMKYVVDAACQMAPALGVNHADVENDFYTAVDDAPGPHAAGMVGENGYINGVVYRYANVNIDLLTRNLAGDADAVDRAIRAYLRSIVTSMPTGRTNSWAPLTLPALVVADIRRDRPVSMADAYSDPVAGGGIAHKAARLLLDRFDRVSAAYDMTPAGLYVTTTMDPNDALFAGTTFHDPMPLDQLIQSAATDATGK